MKNLKDFEEIQQQNSDALQVGTNFKDMKCRRHDAISRSKVCICSQILYKYQQIIQ